MALVGANRPHALSRLHGRRRSMGGRPSPGSAGRRRSSSTRCGRRACTAGRPAPPGAPGARTSDSIGRRRRPRRPASARAGAAGRPGRPRAAARGGRGQGLPADRGGGDAAGLDALAEAAGMSRFHFHRVFKAITGVTPKAYAAAHRPAACATSWRRASTVTEAMYGAGFNSSGRFYATAGGRARDDADQLPGRRRGRGDPLRRRRVLARLDPRRGERQAACARSCSATIRAPWCAISRTGSRRPGWSAGTGVRAARGHGGRVRRGAGDSASISRSTSGAPPSSSGSGRRCAGSRPARRSPTGRSPGASARRGPSGRSRRRARRTPSRSRSPAIGWCGATARSRAIDGASSASAPCSRGRPRRDHSGENLK